MSVISFPPFEKKRKGRWTALVICRHNPYNKNGLQETPCVPLCAKRREDDLDTLRQYDVVYLCGGSTAYLLERVNQTGFRESLLSYIRENGAVIGVSAGSLIFANNLPGNLGLIDTHLDVHCPTGAAPGKLPWPCPNLRLTNNCALAMDGLQVVGISE